MIPTPEELDNKFLAHPDAIAAKVGLKQIYPANFTGPLPSGTVQQHQLFKTSDGNIMNSAQVKTELNRKAPAPQKENLGQIVGSQFDVSDPRGFAGSVTQGVKTVANEGVRLGVQTYNVVKATSKAIPIFKEQGLSGNYAPAGAELDKPRTVLGEQYKPTLSNSQTVGQEQLRDIVGQGVSIASNFLAPTEAYKIATQQGANTLGRVVLDLLKTQTLPGGLQGLGSSLEQSSSGKDTFKAVALNSLLATLVGAGLEGKQLAKLTFQEVEKIQSNFVKDMVSKGYSPQEAQQFAKEGGFFGIMEQKNLKPEQLISHEGAPDQAKVAEYKKMIDEGKPIKPLKVMPEGNKFGIEDGKHRFEAYKQAGVKDVPVQVGKDIKVNNYQQPKVKVNDYQTKPQFTQGEGGRFTGSTSALNPESGFIDPGAMAADAKAAGLKTKTELFDRYAPLQDLVKGSKLGAKSDPYVAARNFAGNAGKIENRLNDLGEILKPNKDILPDVKQYALLDRYQELAGRGISEFPKGETIETINTKKAALEKKLGPEGMARVNKALTDIRAYNDRLLTEAKDAGIISQQSYDAIKAKNQKYIPLQRLEYLADHGDSVPNGSNSFSVSSQNLVQKIKGSQKEVADPIESMVRNTHKTVALVERNKVALKVADLAEKPEFKGIVTKIDGAVPAGMEKFSVFRNGIKEEYAVPKNVGEAMKNLNAQSTDLITRWARFSSGLLRAGATSLNVGFIPSNAIRDFQTATLVSKVGFTPLDWVKGFVSSIKEDATYKSFLENGGGSGYFEGQKNLPKTVKQLTQSKGMKILKTVTNPLEMLRSIGETIEEAPRIGVYKRSLSKGLSGTEAAFNARNSTVDFAKSGNTMKVLNQWVPFLNARLQGTVNMFSAIKSRPISSALKLGAMVGAPVVATYLNNSQKYPDIWNNISTTDKRNNFIIIYGDKVDDQGNPLEAIKIPKGDAKVFSNPLESFLDYLNGTNPKSLQRLAIEMGSDISPIDFENNGKISPRQAIGNVLPPTIKGIVEGATNKNFYTGRDIVPQSMVNASPREQYDNKTSTLAKELGNVLNWSPKKIDNFIKTQFGGLGSQLTSPQTAGSQVTKRFLGAYGGQQDQNIADEAQQAVQAQADAKLELKRQADTKLAELEASPNAAAEFDKLINDNPKLAQAVSDLKDKKDLGFTNKDYVIDQLGVENGERAKFIASQFSKLKTQEQKAALWDDLVNKKLITDKVSEQLNSLLTP